jgi:hypothetical protein
MAVRYFLGGQEQNFHFSCHSVWATLETTTVAAFPSSAGTVIPASPFHGDGEREFPLMGARPFFPSFSPAPGLSLDLLAFLAIAGVATPCNLYSPWSRATFPERACVQNSQAVDTSTVEREKTGLHGLCGACGSVAATLDEGVVPTWGA